MMMKQSIPLTRNLDVADVNIFKEFYIEQSRRVSHLTVTQERTAQFYRMLIDHSLHLGKPLERRCLFYSCSHGICPFWTQVFYAQDFFYQTPVGRGVVKTKQDVLPHSPAVCNLENRVSRLRIGYHTRGKGGRQQGAIATWVRE